MYKIEMLVSNSHVNNNLEMKDVAILNALQDIEGIHINNLKEFTNYLDANNFGIFLMYRQVEILKKPKFGEKIVLATYPYNTNIIGGYRHIYILNSQNEVLVRTNAFGAYVNLKTFQPSRIPKDIINTFKDGVHDDNIENLPRKIKYDDQGSKLIGETLIKKSQIDRYNHVNNAFYVEFVLDTIKEDFQFNRIRAEYMKSYVLGDKVYIYECKTNDANIHTYVLKNSQNELNAVIEFSKVDFS